MVEVTTIEGPYEILDLADGASIELRVLRWSEGLGLMKFPGDVEAALHPVLRVWVPPEIKPIGVPWWDITSKTLRAQFRPHLERADFTRKIFKITAHGVKPTKRFTFEWRPAE